MRLREHEAIVSKGDIFRVDPRKLKIDPGFNIRDLDNPEERPALDELKADIKANGVQVALEIRLTNDELYITSGHRRHKVVMELIAEGEFIASVPATAEPPTVNDAERVLRLRTLNGGKPLTRLQNAEIVRRLIGFGWDRAKIAERCGWTTQNVVLLEETIALPEAVKEQVREGAVSATTARHVVRTEGAERAAQTISQARVTAKEAGKSRVTPRTLSRTATVHPIPQGQPAFIHRDRFNVLVRALQDIARHGDGKADRHSVRMTLTHMGIDCPPEDHSLPDPGKEKRELVKAIRALVDVYREHGTPDAEQPRIIRAALTMLAQHAEAE